ncbi:MAG: hypothetical protein V4650_04155 [Pseudomonadota bacterium]
MAKDKGKEPVISVTRTRSVTTPAPAYDGPTMTGEEVREQMSASFDAYTNYIESPAYKAKAAFDALVTGIPDMGIMHLNLLQASDLVAADMWLSGETDIEGPDADDIVRDDPALLALLKDLRAQLAAQLAESVNNKSLKSPVIRRDLFTGEIDLEKTFVEYDQLYEWLTERSYHPGDWMDGYAEEESNVYSSLIDELYVVRARYAPDASGEHAALLAKWRWETSDIATGIYPDPEQASLQTLREIVKGYSVEVARLNRELGNRVSGDDVRALTPKGRKTLHRLITALCVEAKVNPADRGAAATLAAITQRAGLPVGDDTIRKVLAELPEASKGR